MSDVEVAAAADNFILLHCAAETLWSVDEYYQFLSENWEKTQRLIKGKINTED